MNENKVSKFLKDNAIWAVFAILCVLFAITTGGKFLKFNNIMMLLRQVSMYGIASIGMTFVILLGDIDLAAGSVISFVNIICAYMMLYWRLPFVLAIIITLAIATLVGLLNGIMVAKIGIPALIATFATQTAFAGLSLIICEGKPISGFTNAADGYSEAFKVIGQGWVGKVPVPVIIMALCFLLGWFILDKTYFGRYFYAVGGNIEAAKLSGIRTDRVKLLVFSLSGFFAGLAGIVLLSRTNSAQATAGLGWEFKVITCVVLGGVSVSGGFGRISGVIAGTFIIGALQNGMVLMNLNSWIQDIALGIVLAVAVAIDCVSKKKQAH